MEWILFLFCFVSGLSYIIYQERYYPDWKKIIIISSSCFFLSLLIPSSVSDNYLLSIGIYGAFLSAGIGVLFGVPFYNVYSHFKSVMFSRERKINEVIVFLEKIEFVEAEKIDLENQHKTPLYKKSEKILNDAKKLELDGNPEIAVFRFFESIEKSVEKIGIKYTPIHRQLVFEGGYHIFINLIEKLSENSVWSNYNCVDNGIGGLFKLSNAGYHEATYTLGKYYFDGKYVKSNQDAGLKILRKAEVQGSMKAHAILIANDDVDEKDDNNDNEFSEFLKNLEETLK